MTNLGELTNSILSSLHSYTGVQEVTTWLTSEVDETTTSLPVASTDSVFKGVAEIDDELIYVDTAADGGISLPPFGRGYRGTTAATHAVNAQVVYDPAFPRAEVKRRINAVIAALNAGGLYQIKTTELEYSATAVGYEMPDDVQRILSVTWQVPGDYLNYWEPLYNYRLDLNGQDGKILNLFDVGQPGRTIRVTYQAPLGSLSEDSDELSVAGLQESWADLIEFGVAAHMIRFLDPARLQIGSVENVSRSQVVQVGDAGKVANQMYAMFAQRLQEERKRLLELTPPSIHFQR